MTIKHDRQQAVFSFQAIYNKAKAYANLPWHLQNPSNQTNGEKYYLRKRTYVNKTTCYIYICIHDSLNILMKTKLGAY